MNIKKVLKKIHYRINALKLRLLEKRYDNGVKYIFVNKQSDKLLVVFSGIGSDYNYRRSFRDSSWDQLYIKDSWANGLSYYLYEDGSNHPEVLTSEFINAFLSTHSYSKIVSFGSSKGGSAALYFGIKHHFYQIYCGACQFKVGDYIAIFHKDDNYYPKLMGNIPEEEGIKILNGKFERILEDNMSSNTSVYLVYSTAEHTYDDHIIPLLKKLDGCNIMHKDQIETFPQHSMIGQYMKEICIKEFK